MQSKYIKIFLCSIFVLLISCLGSGVTANLMQSSAVRSGEVKLTDYKYVVIYDSATASFIELELEQLMESHDFTVVGSNQIPKTNNTLGVRYNERPRINGYGRTIGFEITILLEDVSTGRTLLTVSGESYFRDRESAWNALSKKLDAALQESIAR